LQKNEGVLNMYIINHESTSNLTADVVDNAVCPLKTKIIINYLIN